MCELFWCWRSTTTRLNWMVEAILEWLEASEIYDHSGSDIYQTLNGLAEPECRNTQNHLFPVVYLWFPLKMAFLFYFLKLWCCFFSDDLLFFFGSQSSSFHLAPLDWPGLLQRAIVVAALLSKSCYKMQIWKFLARLKPETSPAKLVCLRSRARRVCSSYA